MITVDASDLRSLLQRVGDAPVLTLYLPVDPSDADNQRSEGSEKWRIAMRNQLTKAAELAEPADAIKLEGLVVRAEAFLADYSPTGRTLILVVDDEGLASVELPIVLDQHAAYGAPLLAELVQAMNDHKLYVTVLVDQQSARLVEGYLGYVGDVATLDMTSNWGERGGSRGTHQFRADARADEFQSRYHQYLAREIDRLLAETPEIERLVLGGNAVEAHGVARELGQHASSKLLGVVAMPVDSTNAQVAERITPLAQRFEEEEDFDVTARLSDALAAGLAVAGGPAVLAALDQFLVREILVSSHLTDAGLLEQALRQAVISGAATRFVHREAAEQLDAQDGIVARLYYAAALGL